MNRETAADIADSWYELARGNERLGSAYQRLAAVLQRSLPDDTEAAAGAPVDGQPAVVALAGDGFFVTTFEDREGEESPQPVIERIPLSPTPPALRIADGWRDDASAAAPRGLAVHVRESTSSLRAGHAESRGARRGGNRRHLRRRSADTVDDRRPSGGPEGDTQGHPYRARSRSKKGKATSRDGSSPERL